MLNNLDLLVIAFMVIVAVGLLASCLMLFIKNKVAKRVFLYVASALGLYVCYVGIRIARFSSSMQPIFAVILGLAAIAAIVVERLSKNNEKRFAVAEGLAIASVVLGIINAFA